MSEAAPVTWSLQHALLQVLDAGVNRALAEVGASLSPSALLVGFNVAPAADQAPLVILELAGAGEMAEYDHLAAVVEASRGGSHADPRDSERRARHRVGWDNIRARELEAALQTAPGGGGRCFFAGQSAPVENYEFHPVLSFDLAAMRALPGIQVRDEDGAYRQVSLAHEIITELLRSGTLGLLATRWPSVDTRSVEDRATGVVRRAATRMVVAVETEAGTVATPDLFEAFEALASTAYEGRAGKGAVVLASRDDDHVDVAVRLRNSVPVQNHRQFRKLLELAGARLDLLTDGTTVYGLGRISTHYDGSSQTSSASRWWSKEDGS